MSKELSKVKDENELKFKISKPKSLHGAEQVIDIEQLYLDIQQDTIRKVFENSLGGIDWGVFKTGRIRIQTRRGVVMDPEFIVSLNGDGQLSRKEMEGEMRMAQKINNNVEAKKALLSYFGTKSVVLGNKIYKTRYVFESSLGSVVNIEVDQYFENLNGLWIAEMEYKDKLRSEDAREEIVRVLGPEKLADVTFNKRYSNKSLAINGLSKEEIDNFTF